MTTRARSQPCRRWPGPPHGRQPYSGVMAPNRGDLRLRSSKFQRAGESPTYSWGALLSGLRPPLMIFDHSSTLRSRSSEGPAFCRRAPLGPRTEGFGPAFNPEVAAARSAATSWPRDSVPSMVLARSRNDCRPYLRTSLWNSSRSSVCSYSFKVGQPPWQTRRPPTRSC